MYYLYVLPNFAVSVFLTQIAPTSATVGLVLIAQARKFRGPFDSFVNHKIFPFAICPAHAAQHRVSPLASKSLI
jgi:hypothetical protein